MPGTDEATLAAHRVLATQAAEIALSKMLASLPAPTKTEAEIPAPLKWVGLIIAGLMVTGITTLAIWLVSSVSEMQQTLVRVDERQKAQVESLDSRFSDYDRRITRLEKFHNLAGGV